MTQSRLPALSRAAVLSEMQRRGLSAPQNDSAPLTAATDMPTAPAAAADTALPIRPEVLEYEMKRRGLSKENSSFLEGVWGFAKPVLEGVWGLAKPILKDEVVPFLKGLGSGVMDAGLAEGKLYAQSGVMPLDGGGFSPIPFVPKDIPENIDKLSHSINNTDGYTRMGKAAHKAGQFSGSFLTTPGLTGANAAKSGVVKSIPWLKDKFPHLMSSFKSPTVVNQVLSPHVKTSLKLGIPIGSLSSILEQHHVNPLLADIGASFIAPAAAKKTARAMGYVFSPKLREKILAEKMTRPLKDAVKKTIAENPHKPMLEETAHLPSQKQILKEFDHDSIGAEEAGHVVRDFLADTLDKRQAARRKATEGPYRKLKNLEDIDLSEVSNEIKDTLPFTYGDPKAKLERHLYELNKHKKIDQNALNYYEEFKRAGVSPEALKQIESQLFPHGLENAHSIFVNPAKSDEILRTIRTEATAAAKKEGRGDISYRLNKLADKLEEVLKTRPDVYKPRELYAKHSKPIDEIVKHPVFSKIVEPGKISDTYKISAGAVPKEILNSTMESVDTARDLRKLTGQNTKPIEMLTRYQYAKVLDGITDVDGNVVRSKIKTWARNNPGAFENDPSLKTKLATLSNAKFFESELQKKMAKMNLLETSEFLPMKILKKAGNKFSGASYGHKMMESINKVAREEMREKLIKRALEDPIFFEALKTPLDKHAFWKKHGERLVRLTRSIATDLEAPEQEE